MGFLPQPVITALKEILEQALESALSQLVRDGVVPGDHGVEVRLTRTREREHGDFAANLAMQLARPARRKPREIAERLQAAFPTVPGLAAVEIAGTGLHQFPARGECALRGTTGHRRRGSGLRRSDIGRGQTVQVEFVSANPTGPLHVGHGRGAAYGATVADLLAFCGFEVTREYYVNDAGRQMNILAASVWVRYLEKRGVLLPFPANGYRGGYVHDIADDLSVLLGDAGAHPAEQVLQGLPPDEPDGGDKEAYIDALVNRALDLLGPSLYRQFLRPWPERDPG
jgi:arginyl-tRNA synthetase